MNRKKLTLGKFKIATLTRKQTGKIIGGTDGNPDDNDPDKSSFGGPFCKQLPTNDSAACGPDGV